MTKIVSNKETRIKRHTCELCSTNYVKKQMALFSVECRDPAAFAVCQVMVKQSIVAQKSQ